MKKIPYGESNFEKIIRENFVYVDKTMYLEEMEKTSKLIYLRPRRFGKTLLTSMMDYYYGLDRAQQFEELFQGLHVHQHPTPYRNKYYILKFDFSSIDTNSSTSLEEMREAFGIRVRLGINDFRNRYSLDLAFDENASPSTMLGTALSQFASLGLENKIYVIIDEYDHFTNGMLRGDGKQFLEVLQRGGFVRAFYEGIKERAGAGIVDRFFATGVLPVSLDSMMSGFNIATDVTTRPRFISMTGFRSEEVHEIIETAMPPEIDKEELYEALRINYNGYRFSEENETLVFNSTLVMYYLKRYLEDGYPPQKLVDRNLNTSGISIRNIMDLIDPQNNYKVIEEVAVNNEVVGNIVPYFELDKRFGKNDLVSMLFYMGFLTIKDIGTFPRFRIPNKVMETIYLEYMVHALETKNNYRVDISAIELATMQFGEEGDITWIADLVREFLMHMSSRDTQNFSEKNLKHTFAMILSLSNQYAVYGEYPAGLGFVDIFIQKNTGSRAKYEALIELKYLSKTNAKEADLQKLKEEGKAQLERYMEDKRLQDRENLKKYVIVFLGFEEYVLEEIV